jgi:hypothetical protein
MLKLAIVMLFFYNTAFSEQTSGGDKPADYPTSHSDANQRGTKDVPFIVEILPSLETETVANQKKRENDEKAATDRKVASETQRVADYTWRLSLFTMFLFVVAGVQASLFVWQLILIKRSARDATIAAEAATANAKAVVDNQRPIVGPITTSTNNTAFAVGGGYREFYVLITNSGRSPAQRMKVVFKGKFRPRDWTPRFPPDPTKEPPKTLFPGVRDWHFPFANEPDITQDQFDKINNGTDRMWIIGRIEYFDNLDRHQYTNVCTVWDTHRKVFVPHREHNNAS